MPNSENADKIYFVFFVCSMIGEIQYDSYANKTKDGEILISFLMKLFPKENNSSIYNIFSLIMEDGIYSLLNIIFTVF